MAWTLKIEANVLSKQLRRLSRSDAERVLIYIRDHISNLDNPRQVGRFLRKDLWRYGVGDYRIVSRTQDQENSIKLLLIKHRSQVYRFLNQI